MQGEFLGDWLTAEVAVCCGLLVLWLAQCQGLRNGTRTAVELNPEMKAYQTSTVDLKTLTDQLQQDEQTKLKKFRSHKS